MFQQHFFPHDTGKIREFAKIGRPSKSRFCFWYILEMVCCETIWFRLQFDQNLVCGCPPPAAKAGYELVSIASDRDGGNWKCRDTGWTGTAEVTCNIDPETCETTVLWRNWNIFWLVVWNMTFLFFHILSYINIGNNHPNWLSYFLEGLKPPTSIIYIYIYILEHLYPKLPKLPKLLNWDNPGQCSPFLLRQVRDPKNI